MARTRGGVRSQFGEQKTKTIKGGISSECSDLLFAALDEKLGLFARAAVKREVLVGEGEKFETGRFAACVREQLSLV